jgi:hypothetical protein
MPSKKDYTEEDGNKDPVAFKMAVFAWKEYYKDRYRDNESNTWALIYDLCSLELKTSWKEQKGVRRPKRTMKS